MTQEPVLDRLAGLLLDQLRKELSPSVLNNADDIKLTHPGADADYRFGVFLYGIEEVRPYGVPPPVRLSDEERRHPDLLLALHFLLYANRRTAFDSMSALDELVLLEAAVRAVHSMPPLKLDGGEVKVKFLNVAQSEKSALWQSLNSPLQPAVYLTLEPALIPSTRIKRTPPVREVEVSTKRKGVDQS